MSEATFHPVLQCFIHELEYNFDLHIGTLMLPALSNTDMVGCIAVFLGIDPDVTSIEVRHDDGIDDHMYVKDNGAWFFADDRGRGVPVTPDDILRCKRDRSQLFGISH
jgi:hypothetical protein